MKGDKNDILPQPKGEGILNKMEKTKQKKELNKILEVCPLCRFPKRISGHLFVTDPSIMKLRCSVCKHFPDYIIDTDKKEARVIYRNFNNSEEYFKKIIKFLEINGFKVLKTEVRNSSQP